MNAVTTTKNQDFPDGVYFGMPEDTYHAIPRFSNSGVKNLRESVSDFWECSWMNTDREQNDDDTKAKLWGRAYHCRLNEGRDAFNSRYYFQLDPSVFGDRKVYVTSDDIKAELTALGIGALSKYKKAELCNLLLENVPHALIWDRELEKHAQKNIGRQMIPASWVLRIEKCAYYIEKDPAVSHAFKGGVGEVTILWTKIVEDTDGSGRKYKVRMKARLDHLKFVPKVATPEGVVDFLTCSDLKNYQNSQGKDIDRAIYSAIAGTRMHIQAATYYEAMDEFMKFAMTGRWWPWDENDGIVSDGLPEGFEGMTDKAQPIMAFVFQKSTGAPVARMKAMHRELRVVDIGRIELDTAAVKFAKCLAAFGSDLWVESTPSEAVDDDKVPQYALD